MNLEARKPEKENAEILKFRFAGEEFQRFGVSGFQLLPF
jgi:hypothetical protein